MSIDVLMEKSIKNGDLSSVKKLSKNKFNIIDAIFLAIKENQIDILKYFKSLYIK